MSYLKFEFRLKDSLLGDSRVMKKLIDNYAVVVKVPQIPRESRIFP
jgi:hypothetical protein